MGLLDLNYEDPNAMTRLQIGLGLLNASGGQTSQGIAQALQGGIQNRQAMAKDKRQRDHDELMQKSLQMEFEDRRRKSQLDEAVRGQYQKNYQSGGEAQNPNWSFKDAMTSQEPQYINKPQGMDNQALIKGLYGIGAYDQAMDYQAKTAKQQEEFSTAPQYAIDKKTGAPYAFVQGKHGTHRVLENTLPRDEMKLAHLGGSDVAYSPYTLKDGQVFNKTATIGELMADSRARKQMEQSANQFNQKMEFDKSGGAEGVKPKYVDGQWITPPNNMQAGQSVAAFPSTAKKDAAEALNLITTARELIPKSTGSYIGSGIDQVGRAFGGSTGGAVASAKLKALEASLIAKMPKMTGPQSDKDVLLYKQSAGQVGDSTLPHDVRLGALDVIEEIQTRQAGGAGNNTPAPSVQPPPQDAINMLKMNPKLRAAFDAKYGAGTSASVLGK